MRWIFGILGGLALGVFVAAAHFPIPRQYQLTIRGRVLDENGKPLPDAVIGSQIERRCATIGGGATSRPFAHFRAKSDENGHFELSVHGLYFGYVSFLTLSGCTTVEDRFACKPGYNPVLELNYMHPETMPLRGTYDVAYTLRRGPPTRATGIAFMDLAADALECRADPNGPRRPRPADSVWTDCPQEPATIASTFNGWNSGDRLQTRYYCTPDLVPRVEFAASPAVALLKFVTVITPKRKTPEHEFVWIPNPRYAESPSDPDASFVGWKSVELFAIAESNGILRPIGGVQWSYSTDPNAAGAASKLVPSLPSAWPNALVYAKGQLPAEVAKRLSETAVPQ